MCTVNCTAASSLKLELEGSSELCKADVLLIQEHKLCTREAIVAFKNWALSKGRRRLHLAGAVGGVAAPRLGGDQHRNPVVDNLVGLA